MDTTTTQELRTGGIATWFIAGEKRQVVIRKLFSKTATVEFWNQGFFEVEPRLWVQRSVPLENLKPGPPRRYE